MPQLKGVNDSAFIRHSKTNLPTNKEMKPEHKYSKSDDSRKHPDPSQSEIRLPVAISSVPTLFEQDQLLIGNALNVVGHDLRKELIQRQSFKHGEAQ
ncbi:MAG: hypothetical protein ABIU05_05715, partial [Nitrospirales bacterium]